MYHFAWADQREKQGYIWNITLKTGIHLTCTWLVDKPLIQRCCYSNPQCIVTVTHLVSYTKCYLVNVSTQLLDYKALAICTYNLANKCDIYFGIHSTVVTMGTKWYIILVTWPFVICLICMPSAFRPVAPGPRAHISGKSPMAMLQSLHVSSCYGESAPCTTNSCCPWYSN